MHPHRAVPLHADDQPRGRVLTRRELLTLLAGTGMALSVGRANLAWALNPAPAIPSCVVTPQQTEGPFFADEHLNRADVRSDPSDGSVRPGIPLQLTLRVLNVAGGSCAPLPNAMVDIWHCDASGVYSDFPEENSTGKKFLRGYQTTDANGLVRFTTIYPGWYEGRAVHIHLKIRPVSAFGRGYDFTSQLYFDEAFTDQVHSQPPYAARGLRRTKNNQDGIYRSGGSRLIPALARTASGCTATFDIGMMMEHPG
jgi:protocatechuate 3,4-dioxygenase beta subunit